MKAVVARIAAVFFVFVCIVPAAFAAKKVTVDELSTMLTSLYGEKKTDLQISGELKLIELREELTVPVLNSYSKYQPGPLTVEQLTILQYASQLQLLPAAALADKPAPDEVTQKSILEKMKGYVGNTFSHLPDLSVTKGTARFSDAPLSQIQDFRLSQGNGTLMGGTVHNLTGNYIRFHGITKVDMNVLGGIEKPVSGKAGPANDPQGSVAWGQFGQVLRGAIEEAANGGTLTWSHWEKINKLEAAVFDFSVDRAESHYEVNYCCFPNYDLSGGHIGPSQTIIDWKPFKTTVGYHGQVYVEPNSGYVLRLIVRIDPKTTDFIHEETTRIDYATQMLDGKPYLLPRTLVTLNNVVITGEGGGQTYTEVRAILASEYSNYKHRQ